MVGRGTGPRGRSTKATGRQPADPAQQWLAENFPDEPPLPTDDTGRDHREVALVEDAFMGPVVVDRPGTLRPAPEVRREALASQGEEMAARARGICWRCEERGVEYPTVGLCKSCYKARERWNKRCATGDGSSDTSRSDAVSHADGIGEEVIAASEGAAGEAAPFFWPVL